MVEKQNLASFKYNPSFATLYGSKRKSDGPLFYLTRDEQLEMIDNFILRHGITVCPSAFDEKEN